MKKIIIVSDGTPESTKILLNGVEVPCQSCYLSFNRYDGINDEPGTQSLNFDFTLTQNGQGGESVSTTYRLSKRSEAGLIFEKLEGSDAKQG